MTSLLINGPASAIATTSTNISTRLITSARSSSQRSTTHRRKGSQYHVAQPVLKLGAGYNRFSNQSSCCSKTSNRLRRMEHNTRLNPAISYKIQEDSNEMSNNNVKLFAAALFGTIAAVVTFPLMTENESAAIAETAANTRIQRMSLANNKLQLNNDIVTTENETTKSSIGSNSLKENGKLTATTALDAVSDGKSKDAIDMKKEKPRSYNVSVRAVRGGRLYMEDEYFVLKEGNFAAVFDGHGGNGVSLVLKERLYNKICHCLAKLKQRQLLRAEKNVSLFQKLLSEKEDFYDEENKDSLKSSLLSSSITHYISAIREAFNDIDNEVLNDPELEHQGSTAVAVFIHEDPESKNCTIISANVGDSRAVLSREKKAIDLTRDHKPNDSTEKERILSMGGTIEWDSYSSVFRVRNLSLSRAIGDKFAKPVITSEAEIKQFDLQANNDEFIILASDGLWDALSSQEAVAFVHKRLNAPLDNANRSKSMKKRKKLMSRYLAHEALLRGSADNICVVLIWLRDEENEK